MMLFLIRKSWVMVWSWLASRDAIVFTPPLVRACKSEEEKVTMMF